MSLINGIPILYDSFSFSLFKSVSFFFITYYVFCYQEKISFLFSFRCNFLRINHSVVETQSQSQIPGSSESHTCSHLPFPSLTAAVTLILLAIICLFHYNPKSNIFFLVLDLQGKVNWLSYFFYCAAKKIFHLLYLLKTLVLDEGLTFYSWRVCS